MNFSKRNKYALLVLLVLLNIVFRIPTSPHELGTDSFKIHSYANIISSYGFGNWIIHPLSIFGMYPYSTPSAVPFLQSGVSQSTNLSMEYTILITSIIIGLIGMFTAYIMAKEIKNDDLFALLVAFCFSLSPLFLSFTIWMTSARHLFIALVPFFIWALMRCYNKSQSRLKYIILIIISFVILGMIHHMVLLLVPVLAAYVGALIFRRVKMKYYIFNNKINLVTFMTSIIFFIVYISFITLQVFRLYFYEDFNIWWKYQSGFFFHGTGAEALFGNMIVDYASKVGILSLFALPGLLIFLRKSKRNLYQNFLLMALLAFAPIITLGWYVPSVLLSFFCVLLVYGILNLNNVKPIQKFVTHLIAICILTSTIFSIFMLWNWGIVMPSQGTDYLQDSTKNMGLYLKDYHTTGTSFISNYDERKISSVSELPYPPPDTAYIFSLINESDLGINSSFSLSSLAHLDDHDAIYKPNINYRAEYRGQSYDIDSDRKKRYNLKYNIEYVVQDNMMLGKAYSGRPDKFYLSVSEKTPKIYDNNELSVWYIGE